MKEYVEKKLAIEACYDGYADCRDDCADNIRALPVCKVREVVTCGECLNCEKYESRLYVVRKTGSFGYNTNLRFAQKIAVFDLCKVPAVSDRMRKYKNTDSFVYADDGNTEIVKDDYGEALKEIPLADAIKILEDAAATDDYWRYKPCIAFLKEVQKRAPGEIVVLHYGY